MICKICEREFNSTNGLGRHFISEHKDIDRKTYYIENIMSKDISEKCICGEFKKFINFTNGFAATCGNKECNFKQKSITTKENCLKKYGVENPSQIPGVGDKIKEKYNNKTDREKIDRIIKIKNTKLEKYKDENYNNWDKTRKTWNDRGYDNNSQTTEWREKVKETSLKKSNGLYDHHLKNPKTINKRINNLINNENIINVFQREEVREKSKISLQEKYGENYINPGQIPIIRNKVRLTCFERYNVENFTQSEEYKKILREKAINKFFCSDRLKGLVIPMFTKEQCNLLEDIYKWECVKCQNIFEDNIENGKIPRCLKCYPITSGTSGIEKEIFEWLSQYVFCKKERFYYNSKHFYELDIYIKSKKFGIELDGIYYHSEINGKKPKNYHISKTTYFDEIGIDIIHIWDIEWINNKELVKSMILSKLGLNKNIIYARKCSIQTLTNTDSNLFLEENHLQGSINSKINLGLYYNNELVQLLNISKPRYNKKYEWEILRFCSLKNYTIVGGFSKLLNYFIENYNPNNIITYADLRISKGNVYLKNGFDLINQTNPNYFYMKDSKKLYSRIEFQKHKLKDKLKIYDETLSEWENMQLNKYDRIWDCGNLVFEWNKLKEHE